MGKIKKILQNLYEILEIFENFKKILRKFWRNFEEIFLFAYSFQINFPNHHVSGKNFWGARAPLKVKPVKIFLVGGACLSPRTAYGGEAREIPAIWPKIKFIISAVGLTFINRPWH